MPGLDRMRKTIEAKLDDVASVLPRKRITEEDRDTWIAEAVEDIKKAKTASALGKAGACLLKTALRVYLGGA